MFPIALSFLALALTAVTPVFAADEPAQARVEARLRVTQEGRSLGDAAHGADLSLGQSAELVVGVHQCAAFSGRADHEGVVWRISVTLEGADEDQFAVAYSWSKRTARPASELEEGATETGQMTLTHGRASPVDLVRLRPSAGPSCNVFVELGASLAVRPELADRIVHHELWLVHTDPEGRESSVKLDLAGEQGEAMPFTYELRKLELPVGGRAGRGGSATLVPRVSGSLRSWWTAEDEVLLVVETDLSLRADDGAGLRSTISNGEGVKKLRVETGEAVKIVLPPFQGIFWLEAPATEEALLPGVQRQGDRISIDAQKLLGRDQLALLIEVSR